jgi:TM2 domain-containing membrane protein YozV
MSEKSPILAGVLSWILPGVGQYYNGRPEDITKGLIIDAAAVGGIVLIVVGASSAINSVSQPVTTYGQAQTATSGIGGDATLVLIGWTLYVAADVFGIVDAIMSADDINNHRLKPRTDNLFRINPTLFADSTNRAVPAMDLSMRF